MGVVSGMCRGKVHAYAGTLFTGEPESVSNDGKACWKPAMPPHHPHARKGQAVHRASSRATLQPELPPPSLVTGSPPGACPLQPQCHPLRLPTAQSRVCWGEGGGEGGWLSQLKPRLKALFLLAPSWQYFCRSVSSEEPAIYFAGSSPCLGSLSGTPDPCPALANVL